jgi:cobalt-zinc-cadmium efflux system membrane fusion protein
MKRFVLVAIAVLAGCKSAPAPAPPPAALESDAGPHAAQSVTIDAALIRQGRVQIGTAELRAPREGAWIPGEIVPGERGEADVTSLSPGRVATLEVALGDAVRHGQVVATIDAPEVGRASADVLRARSRAGLAAHALSRQLELETRQATSKSAVDEARAEDAAARADWMAARTLLASLGGAEVSPSDAQAPLAPTRVALRAPIDGVVTSRTAVLGAPVSPDKPLLHIVARSARVVMARLPETLEAAATAGTRVRVRPRSASLDPSRECGAAVTANLGVVDDARNIPLRITLDDGCPELPSGRFVEVGVPTSAATDAGAALLLVPEAAVTDLRGTPTVFVAGGSAGQFIARGVRPGRVYGADVSIESGLAIGERVVTVGAILLKGELLKAELQ